MVRLRPGARGLRRLVVLLALPALLAGCASAPPPPPQPAPGTPLPRVALLPLENLSGRADAGDLVTRMLFVGLVRTQRCQVVEAGTVDRAMEDLRIWPVGTVTRRELAGLRDSLGVDYVLVGTLLEDGPLRTAEGDVPSVGVALKLLDAGSGRVVWAQMRIRTGEDRETVFGWGRELSRERIAAELATDLFRDFQVPARPDTAAGNGGRR
jgi:TolB-like protein